MGAWWLCPNEPRCPHAAVFHDVETFDDGEIPRCCVDGCPCGAIVSGRLRQAVDGSIIGRTDGDVARM